MFIFCLSHSNRNLKALLGCFAVIILNYIFQMGSFMSYFPYIYIDPQFINYFTKNDKLILYWWHYHWAVIVFTMLLTLLTSRLRKIEFTEEI
ncbi:hypothetical protein GCM10010917_05700 [Paenibacillus physcomitrellae]|uniref:Uncharacterized protein n=1 Tax=Paenibacillus physcomitrellae TaxID=1619311 RepID=A0ABQ1FQM8_9BACL|nr:hypothetical protein GCM10010917_05700 [Paenibacillus physcomitrellae]